MVTAEMAVALPVLVIVLGVALAGLSIGSAQLSAQDAAAQVARAVGRGDAAAGSRLFEHAAPRGATYAVSTGDGEVTATVRLTARPLGGLLGGFTIREQAVAAVELAPDGSPTP
jgi:hypothetical protein